MEEEECGATHVNQKIAWLQVAVPDIRRVNVLQRTEDLRSKDKPTATKCTSDGISPRGKHANTTVHWGGAAEPGIWTGERHGTCAHLVHEVPEVLVGERLVAPNDLVQVCVHQLRDLVHIAEVGSRGRRLDVDQRDDLRHAAGGAQRRPPPRAAWASAAQRHTGSGGARCRG